MDDCTVKKETNHGHKVTINATCRVRDWTKYPVRLPSARRYDGKPDPRLVLQALRAKGYSLLPCHYMLANQNV